jgi:hypothetical protein
MNAQEKKKIGEVIVGTAELLGREMSPVAVTLYAKAVEDLPFELVSAAFSDLVRQSKFFPAPAELREMVLGPPEKLEDLALIESSKVVEAVKRYGGNKSVVFDDPVTMAVIQQVFGGWERMSGEMTLDQEKWWRKEFVKAYQAYARSGIKAYGVLYGILDRCNDSAGFDMAPPVLIGDRERAMKVKNYEAKEKTAVEPGLSGRMLSMVAGIRAS